MPEPLHEAVENAWLAFLNRFDTEIYPVLFKDRGYTKGEALLAWHLSQVNEGLDDLYGIVHQLREES